jgi:hypothetical protein
MNRIGTLDMEIQRCESEYYALGAESASSSIQRKPYIEISAVATAIVKYLTGKQLVAASDPEIQKFSALEQYSLKFPDTNAYTYRQIQIVFNGESLNKITDLAVELWSHIDLTIENTITEQTIKPLGFSIQSRRDDTPSLVILLAENMPPNDKHCTVIILSLNGKSATTLYDQCKRMSLSPQKTVELFHFFYKRYVTIRSKEADHPTLITDGTEGIEKLRLCRNIIDDISITLTSLIEVDGITKNTCFETCRTVAFDIYHSLLDPCTRYLPTNNQFSVTAGGHTIWIKSHPFFPGKTLYITKQQDLAYFTLEHKRGTNEASPNAIHVVNCHSKETLFYCIFAFMEPQGEDSLVCKELRRIYIMPYFSAYSSESSGGVHTYNIPCQQRRPESAPSHPK